MKQKNKIIIFISFFLIVVILFLIKLLSFNKNSISPEKSVESPFKITKLAFYSGIIPKNTSFSSTENWYLDISQYTDIAIYISNDSKTLTKSNTIQSMYLNNFQYINTPKIGKQDIYYQNPLKFATDYVDKDNLINNHLTYNILNLKNEENLNYYSTPTFFTDCSIPITLKYLNSSVLPNFSLPNNESLSFNGRILKNSSISLEQLKTSFSFDINIVTNENKLYYNTLRIDIPLNNTNYNLFDQNIYIEQNLNYKLKNKN